MKIKKWKSLPLFLYVLLAGMIFQTKMVQAAETQASYEPERNGSITVHLDDIGTEQGNVGLSCYRVGRVEVSGDMLLGFLAEEDFVSLNLNLNELGDTTKHKEAADRLVEFLEENEEIEPLQSGVTDGEGNYSFRNLAQGMYFILQTSQFDTYGTIQPFFLSIPYREDGIFLYEVETETKAERPDTPENPKDPNDPEEPTEEEPPSTRPGTTEKPVTTTRVGTTTRTATTRVRTTTRQGATVRTVTTQTRGTTTVKKATDQKTEKLGKPGKTGDMTPVGTVFGLLAMSLAGVLMVVSNLMNKKK